MNEAFVSLTGYVASQPRLRNVRSGIPVLSMRVAWTPRWLDRLTGEWSDGSTSYATVTCWRKLADNAAVCLRKGDPVVVKGRLSVRTYADRQGVQRTQVDVDATSVGHDLNRGVAQFQRTRPATGQTAAEHAGSLGMAGPDGGDLAGVPGQYGGPDDLAAQDEAAELREAELAADAGQEAAAALDGQPAPDEAGPPDEEDLMAAEPAGAAAGR